MERLNQIPAFSIERLASPGGRISTYDIPRWAQSINDYWLAPERGPVMSLILEDQTDEAWEALGRFLITDLVLREDVAGLCFEGLYPATGVAMDWARALADPDATALRVMEFRWTSEPLRERPLQGGPVNVALSVLESTDDAAWMRGLLSQTGSEIFDHATDLVLAGYPSGIRSVSWRDTPLTRDRFSEALTQANAWIKPGDGWGFTVGAAVGSSGYRSLLRQANT